MKRCVPEDKDESKAWTKGVEMSHAKRIPSWISVILSALLILSFALFTGGAGCPPDDDDDDATGDDDDVTGDDDTGDDDAIEPFAVSGNIYAIPVYYEPDEFGNWQRHELEWTDVNAEGYNLGLFYAAITPSREGMDNPFVVDVPGEVPVDPKNEGTAFSLIPEADDLPPDLENVHVMAAVDSYNDSVLSGRDGMVFYPEPISVNEGPVTVNLMVDVEFKWCDAWVVGYHGEGCGGGCGDLGTVGISGQAVLHGTTHIDATGDSIVAVYDENGGGPWWINKPGQMDGANQDDYLPWDLTVCGNMTVMALGAWDWNNNLLFEPSDDWGITVDGIGGDVIHEWELGDADVSDMLIRMPESFGLPLWNPYVKVSGLVGTDGTFEFSDLPEGSRLAVLGGKIESLPMGPVGDLLEQGLLWGFQDVHNVEDVGDAAQFEIWVKPYNTVYLTVGIDTDGDELPNSDYFAEPTAVYLENENVTRNITMTYRGD